MSAVKFQEERKQEEEEEEEEEEEKLDVAQDDCRRFLVVTWDRPCGPPVERVCVAVMEPVHHTGDAPVIRETILPATQCFFEEPIGDLLSVPVQLSARVVFVNNVGQGKESQWCVA